MGTIAWLFDEAWERRRGRRRHAWGVAVLIGACTLALLTIGPLGPAAMRPLETPFEPSAQLVRAGSYLAIHCPQPNSIACDQLALEVTLKRRATTVTATIDGHSWPMNRWGDQLVRARFPRRVFVGYLSHAGIRSRLHVHPGPGDLFINDARSPGIFARVTLLVRLRSGPAVMTRLRLYLRDGWG